MADFRHPPQGWVLVEIGWDGGVQPFAPARAGSPQGWWAWELTGVSMRGAMPHPAEMALRARVGHNRVLDAFAPIKSLEDGNQFAQGVSA
jgi:hypothetical protein